MVLVHTLALHMKRFAGREVKRSASRAQGPEAETLRRLKAAALIIALHLTSCTPNTDASGELCPGHTDIPFNQTAWTKGDMTSRGGMAKDLIMSNRLTGMSSPELRGLLGPPDDEDKEFLAYWIRNGRSQSQWCVEMLYVEIDTVPSPPLVRRYWITD
jgi:hypothetical protein